MLSEAATAAGRLIVLAAPSGAGKTTLVHRLVQANADLRFSVSYTTRPPRPNEAEGRDYHFVDREAFAAMLAAGEFLEHAEVFDHYYGTSRSQVDRLLHAGHNVILEIDWQGARQVRARMTACICVFILPPSVDELHRRLTGRGTDTPAVIERRFRDALSDMSHWQEFDYAVINDDLVVAASELDAIVVGHPASAASATDNPALQQRIARILG